MEHAVSEQRAADDAKEPTRMRERIPCRSWRHAERQTEPAPHIVLAVPGHGHIGGDHECLITARRDTIQHRRQATEVAREIALKPRPAVILTHRFQFGKRRAADNIRDVCFGRGPRHQQVAASRDDRGASHRRNSERRGIRLAKQRARLAARRHIDERSRNEGVASVGFRRAALRGAGLNRTRDEAIEHARKLAPGDGFKFFDVEHARKRPPLVLRSFGRFLQRGSRFVYCHSMSTVGPTQAGP